MKVQYGALFGMIKRTAVRKFRGCFVGIEGSWPLGARVPGRDYVDSLEKHATSRDSRLHLGYKLERLIS